MVAEGTGRAAEAVTEAQAMEGGMAAKMAEAMWGGGSVGMEAEGQQWFWWSWWWRHRGWGGRRGR